MCHQHATPTTSRRPLKRRCPVSGLGIHKSEELEGRCSSPLRLSRSTGQSSSHCTEVRSRSCSEITICRVKSSPESKVNVKKKSKSLQFDDGVGLLIRHQCFLSISSSKRCSSLPVKNGFSHSLAYWL